MKILHKNNVGKWEKINRKEYVNEAELQQLLADDVAILPLEEAGYDVPFITIGKEVSLANGYLDLLAVSTLGHVLIIETKLNSNPEVKRTVVGQILGYSAYLWKKNYEDFNNYFKDYLRQQKSSFKGDLIEYLKISFGEKFSENEFKEGLEKRLELGSFSLFVVVDKANQELKDIANYLNDRTGQEIDFYVIEVEQIGDGKEKFLIPKVINPLRKSVSASESGDKYDRSPLTKEEFYSRLDENGKRIADELMSELSSYNNIFSGYGKSGFAFWTPVPEKYKEGGKYRDVSYTYLWITAGTPENPSKNGLHFMYPEGFYKDVPGLRPVVDKYRAKYKKLPEYGSGNGVYNLSKVTDEMVSELIKEIKNIADTLGADNE